MQDPMPEQFLAAERTGVAAADDIVGKAAAVVRTGNAQLTPVVEIPDRTLEESFRQIVEFQIDVLAARLDEAFEQRLQAMNTRVEDIDLRLRQQRHNVDHAPPLPLPAPQPRLDMSCIEDLVERKVERKVEELLTKGFDRAWNDVESAIKTQIVEMRTAFDEQGARCLEQLRSEVELQHEGQMRKLESCTREEQHKAQVLLVSVQQQLQAVQAYTGVIDRVEEQHNALLDTCAALQILVDQLTCGRQTEPDNSAAGPMMDGEVHVPSDQYLDDASETQASVAAPAVPLKPSTWQTQCARLHQGVQDLKAEYLRHPEYEPDASNSTVGGSPGIASSLDLDDDASHGSGCMRIRDPRD